MKSAEWIMASGVVFSVGFFALAFFSDDPWEDHVYDRAAPIGPGVPAPHRDGREKMVCSSCHEIIAQPPGTPTGIPPIVLGGPVPHTDGREKRVCSGCHQIVTADELAAWKQRSSGSGLVPILRTMPAPHRDGRERQVCSRCHRYVTLQELAALRQRSVTPPAPAGVASVAAPVARTVALQVSPEPPPADPAARFNPEWHELFTSTRFQGQVMRLAGESPASGRRNLHVLVDNGVARPSWINLAPPDFLQRQGCWVMPGMYVKGTAFREIGRGPDALVYGATLSVNGHLCLLRDSHLRGAWEPRFDGEAAEE
ncbi:MAG: magnetochrome domain-containing protein [Magnetococcus sp. WYHC-3]